MTEGLNETVKELQQLLQTVSRQLAKGQEGVKPLKRYCIFVLNSHI